MDPWRTPGSFIRMIIFPNGFGAISITLLMPTIKTSWLFGWKKSRLIPNTNASSCSISRGVNGCHRLQHPGHPRTTWLVRLRQPWLQARLPCWIFTAIPQTAPFTWRFSSPFSTNRTAPHWEFWACTSIQKLRSIPFSNFGRRPAQARRLCWSAEKERRRFS